MLAGAGVGLIPVCCVSCLVGQGFGGEHNTDNIWADVVMLSALVSLPLLGAWLGVGVAKRSEDGDTKK